MALVDMKTLHNPRSVLETSNRSDKELLRILYKYLFYLEKGVCDLNKWLKTRGTISSGESRRLQKLIDDNLPERNKESFVYRPGDKESREKWLLELISKCEE